MKGVWGVDLGGTKIEVAVLEDLDSRDPKAVCRKRLPTGSDKGYEHILDQLKKVVDQVSDDVGEYPEIIGMGTPGSTDPATGYLKNSNSTSLNFKPFKADVETKLGIPVVMANDANCFALAEARMGAVRRYYPDARTVFGVIMGTGSGGGIVVDGKVLNGHHGISGEWGHNFLDQSGGDCYCGKKGCVEMVIAGPALEAFYKKQSGKDLRMPGIVERHIGKSDPFATQTIERLLHFFGLALSGVINILDPDVVVIGGGLGNIDLLYSEGPKQLTKHVFNNTFSTPLLKPLLGDSAGVFGAALLVAPPGK